MKPFISTLLITLVLLISLPVLTQAAVSASPSAESAVTGCMQIKGPVSVETAVSVPSEDQTGNFLTRNWGALFLGLLSFYDVVARLTPTKKDNSIVSFLTMLYNAIVPNLKKGGGKL